MSTLERRLERWDWPHREHSRFVLRGGVRWHVQVLGEGPALLLVHGTGASSHSFRELMPLLARRFTVVAPDLPGHGFSSAPPSFRPGLTDTAAALGDLLGALALTPQVAVGHSAGAALIASMELQRALAPQLLIGLAAALLPLRGLVHSLFGPAARLLAQSPVAAHGIALGARDPQRVDRLIRGTGSRLNARGVQLYQQLARSPDHVSAVLAMLASWDLEPLFAALPDLRTPFLLLAGAADQAIPLSQQRQLAERLPQARLHVVSGAGHLLHEEQPDAVARLMLAAIAEHAAPRGPRL